MFRLAICDDDSHSLTHMIALVNEYRKVSPLSFEYAAFSNGMELTSALEQGKHFDIYCLDIVMPGFDGIKLGKEIREYDKSAAILYFTSSPEFALDSYSVHAANYILKPVTKEKLFEVLTRVFEQMKHKEETSITVKTTQGIEKILLSSLVYAEAMGRKVLLHLNSGRTLECSIQFSKICDNLLELPYFLKSHRSYVVNMNYINTIENTEIILHSSDAVPIAQGKTREMKDTWLTFQMKHN